MSQRVVVIGTGYVGLPLAIMLARSGYEVIGVDIDENTVDTINKGTLPISEEDIREVFEEPAVKNNLRAQRTPCDNRHQMRPPNDANRGDTVSLTAGVAQVDALDRHLAVYLRHAPLPHPPQGL